MCEVTSKGKTTTKQGKKKMYSGQQQKINKMDWDEPHLAPNEKTQPIQWTEWPTGALVAAGSLWLILQPLKVRLHLEGHTPVTWVPIYSRLCMNLH
jgi:hypothetical protein